MQLQFHPPSGRGTVRTFTIGLAGERAAIAAAALLLAMAGSLWITVPGVLARRLREGEAPAITRELEWRRAEWNREENLARSLRDRALGQGDLFNRIAFLYALPVSQWPRVLNPQAGIFAVEKPERIASAVELYLRGLERAYALVQQRERDDPDLARRTPAVVPIRDAVFEPSAFFGPHTSRWTGGEEFFLGVDFAAPTGSAVVAPADGVVVFAGTVRRGAAGWFWRLGNLVVLTHGSSGATVYGHLSEVSARRGRRLVRGERLGSVGATGWAISPQLHYEYWRPEGEGLRPTDPLFAALDGHLGRPRLSLEEMEATSAPGPFDPLPGIQISAEKVAAPRLSSPTPGRRRAHRRRI
jgi:murein DD-endopeptidase MepM/ murein hydrolase activator NlpD